MKICPPSCSCSHLQLWRNNSPKEELWAGPRLNSLLVSDCAVPWASTGCHKFILIIPFPLSLAANCRKLHIPSPLQRLYFISSASWCWPWCSCADNWFPNQLNDNFFSYNWAFKTWISKLNNYLGVTMIAYSKIRTNQIHNREMFSIYFYLCWQSQF